MKDTAVSVDALKEAFDTGRLSALIDDFATIGGEESEGVTRPAFSREDARARIEFIELLQSELDVDVSMDSLGNIFAQREGLDPDLPSVMTGSHLDSVRNGGRFDGPAGVFAAFEGFRVLDILGIKTRHPFILTVLTSEEPNDFGISTFGSRGLAGKLDRAQLESLRDQEGRNFRNALAALGGDLDRIEEAVIVPGEIKYFVELHIEQMPFLEQEHKDIGVVKGVTGIYREKISIRGEAGHCGTTPMAGRRDALCAASELTCALESAAKKENNAVATIGRLDVYPNSVNTIPGRVEMVAEIRCYDQDTSLRIITSLSEAVGRIQETRGVGVDRTVLYDTRPTGFSSQVREAVTGAAERLGFSTLDQVSMAGHDAAHMNDICEAGMIFVPSKGGLSHCPSEWTDAEDLVKGARCLLQTLLLLDQK